MTNRDADVESGDASSGGDDRNLAVLIRKTARDVRGRDYLWTAGIGAGVAVALVAGAGADARLAVGVWLAFLGALAMRYLLSSGRTWAQPVQSAVDVELGAQRSELANLRIARGVAQALPEPLFIVGHDGVVDHANPAAEALVGSTGLAGRHFASVLRAPDVFEAAELAVAKGVAQTVDFTTTGSIERYCRAFIAPLEDAPDGGGHRCLVFVRDLTSEKRLEKMRADFIASASHELRTPLASMIGFIETLRGHARDDEAAQEKFLPIMQAQAERMQRLVADLMSLSRIELNEHVPPRDVLDLAIVTADVVDSLGPVAEKKSAIIDLHGPDDQALPIFGERDEIFQAVQNLIDNAIKYGGSPAMIKIRVGLGEAPPLSSDAKPGQRLGDTAARIAAQNGIDADGLRYVQIRDFGPGVERASLPRLTERFYRVSVERSRESGGTGLGLAIVKHILNRHNAGFQIESELGRGTAFTCYFLPPSVDHAGPVA